MPMALARLSQHHVSSAKLFAVIAIKVTALFFWVPAR